MKLDGHWMVEINKILRLALISPGPMCPGSCSAHHPPFGLPHEGWAGGPIMETWGRPTFVERWWVV